MGKGTENGQADENFNENIIQDWLREVGENIAAWRKKRDLTQDVLADFLNMGFSKTDISRFENGQRQMRIGTFLAISEILRVSPNDLAPEDLVINATTQPSAGINFRYDKLNDQNKAIIRQLIEALLLQQRF